MVKDWRRRGATMVILLVIAYLIIVPMAAADRGEKHWSRGEGWKGESRHHGDWDRDRWGPGYYSSGYYSSGYYSAPAYSYPVAVPVPVYVPVNYGGNSDACYRACMASGQYSPNQCAQSCYPAY